MDEHRLARTSNGPASISNRPASIESLLLFTKVLSAFKCVSVAFCMVVKWYRLKPAHCPESSVVRVLKPMHTVIHASVTYSSIHPSIIFLHPIRYIHSINPIRSHSNPLLDKNPSADKPPNTIDKNML